jgi:aryl-alcohol dehydrogenase-like predicted oxidoreductase
MSNPVPMREIQATLEAAVAAGVTLFDTADIYGQGDSERTLRRLAARHPNRLFVVTKVGYRHGRLTNVLRFAKPIIRAMLRPKPETRGKALQLRAQLINQNFSPEYLRRAVDGSRRRLGVDRLDGLLLHDPPIEILLSPHTHELLAEFLDKKQAAHVGISANSIEEIDAAVAIPAVTMIQIPMAVAETLPGTDVEARLRRRDIAVMVRQIIRNAHSTSQDDARPDQAFAAAVAHPLVTSAIVGVSTRAHLQEFLRSAQ